MGVGFIYLLIILILSFLISISLLIYFIKKRKIVGIVICSVFCLIFISLFFINDIDAIQINKNDVKEDLKFLNVSLDTDFKILNNKVTGMPERFQETEIEISNLDRKKIISNIKKSKNFKILKTGEEIIKDAETDNIFNNKNFLNFQFSDFYSREIYIEVHNIPTRFFLQIKDNSNKLSYQRIEN